MATFKWLVRLRIAANLVLAVYFMIWDPDPLIKFMGFTGTGIADWVRAAGALYIFVTFAYLPSAVMPDKARVANLFPTFAPILPILLFFWLGGGFIWFGLYELVFLLALNLTYRRAWIADLMQKP